MPSSLSHALAAVALASATMPRQSWRAVAVLGAVSAVSPDVDALPHLIGRADVSALGGHRGLTHSIAFAVGIAGVVALAASQRVGMSRSRLFAYLAPATLSHGVMDAFSDYGSGLGITFLAPFSDIRFLAPWRPIAGEFSELLLCLLPLALITVVSLRWRNIPVGLRFRERVIELKLTEAGQSQDVEPSPVPPSAN